MFVFLPSLQFHSFKRQGGGGVFVISVSLFSCDSWSDATAGRGIQNRCSV